MEDHRRDCLLKTLAKLDEDELKMFLHHLRQMEPKNNDECFFSTISDHKLLTDFLLDNFGVDYGIKITVKVLKVMNLEKLAEYLVELQCNEMSAHLVSSLYLEQKQKESLAESLQEQLQESGKEDIELGSTDEHFVDQHRDELIQHTSKIHAVLGHLPIDQNDSLCLAVRKERTNIQKMQKLYEMMASRDRKFKDDLYHSLLVTNKYLIKDLERIDFLNKYKKELIRRVIWIGNNLQMRLRDILNSAEYEAIMAESTDNQKMEKLYELLPSWDRKRKVQLYWALKSTNRNLILQLEGADPKALKSQKEERGKHVEGTFTKLSQHLLPMKIRTGHFVEQEQDELIQRTSGVPGVLERLKSVALTQDQYKDVMFEPTDILRMRKLYNLVPHWSKEQKDHLYRVLLETNRFLITELKGKYFVDEHELAQRVSGIDNILQQLVPQPLHPDQYKAIMAESTDTLKMEKLYKIMLNWDVFSKRQLYDILYSTNKRVTLELEDEHFVDQHRDELIQHTSETDLVLGRLAIAQNSSRILALREESTDILKMQKLYELMASRDRKFKDDLYRSLLVTNKYLIEDLKGIDFFKKHKEELIRRVSWEGNSLQMRLRDILNSAEYEAIMAERTDKQKMEKLYELLPSWDRRIKVPLYQALKSTNRNLILQLEAVHFVEKEQDELIQHTSRVPDVLSKLETVALTLDQYKDIMFEPTDILRMRKLYSLVPHWSKEQKDHLYRVLLDTNRFLITELKGKYFVDRHEHELVQRVCGIDSILQQLVPHPLGPDQYKAIMAESTDTQKMEKLYEIMLSWDGCSKRWLHGILYSTNKRLTLELEGEEMEGHTDSFLIEGCC